MPIFQPFGPDHWMVLGMTAAVLWLMIANARRLRRAPRDGSVRAALALVLWGNEAIGLIGYALAQGRVRVPCQLCDLAMILMGWALLGSPRVVEELAFCWGLAGSLQALLTPDVAAGFPSGAWLTFFLGHGTVVIAAVYLATRGRLRLTMVSVWRVWLIGNGYVVLAGLLNLRLGTNFGYLAGKPEHPSVLDYLGPWPVYIVGMEAIGLASFFLCLGVSRMIDRVAAVSTVKGTRDV